MKLPDYNDDEALIGWASEQLTQLYDDDEMEHYLRPWYEASAVRVVNTEDAAIRAAEDGNFDPLASLLESGAELSPKARVLMASRLRGTFKVRRRRPKQTAEQAEAHPAYWANKEVDDIVALLDQYYPDGKARMDRAVTIAARRAGIKRRVLESYRK